MNRLFAPSDPVVPILHARTLVDAAVEGGADRDALILGGGIPDSVWEDLDAHLSYEDFEVFERLAERLTPDPSLALRWGRAACFSHFGFPGLAAMSSANLGAAIRIAQKYNLQLIPGWQFSVRVEDDRAVIVVQEVIERGDLLRFASEAVAAGLYSLAKQALGRAPSLRRVRVKYGRPAHVALYPEFFGDAEFSFDQPVAEAEFDLDVLLQPLVSSAPKTARLLEQASHLTPSFPGGSNLVEQVRDAIAKAGTRRLSLLDVARALRTSTRSLRRALSEVGTSYQEIATEVLRGQAEKLVRADGAKIDFVARELGFTDARSFRRAFKRWTGQSPNEFRRRESHH